MRVDGGFILSTFYFLREKWKAQCLLYYPSILSNYFAITQQSHLCWPKRLTLRFRVVDSQGSLKSQTVKSTPRGALRIQVSHED